MKKNSFIKGTLITTICIIITKVLGVLYVIPFYSIIGSSGGALYSYAYTIYLFFMSISSSGIPQGISRIISYYQSLGYTKTSRKTFVISRRIVLLISFICFLIVFIFAPNIASLIVGGVHGTNSINDISFVIRCISFAIIISSLLSVYRGYFEGYRYIEEASYSQVIEQLVRVLIIIFGSLCASRIFKLNVVYSVGISLVATSIGGIVSYLYLDIKYRKNRSKFNRKLVKSNEPIISNSKIINSIILIAVPFIMIDICKSLYNYIDMFQVVKVLNGVGFKAREAEEVYSIMNLWASKFNMISTSICSGIIINLIPNLTESITKGNYNKANSEGLKALNIMLFIGIPLTLGISFLAHPIWALFYGDSIYGVNILSYYIFTGLISSLMLICITILQCYKDYKGMFISLISGVLVKGIFNKSLVNIFNGIGSPAYYGFITASILGYIVSLVISLVILNRKYKVNLEDNLKYLFDILIGSFIMIVILYLFKFIIPIYSKVRINNLFIIIVYGVIGILVYFYYSKRSHLLDKIFVKKK